MSESSGQWVRKSGSGTAVVFVHGILSSSYQAWRNGDVYWPVLLTCEEEIRSVGVYVFSYRSDALVRSYSLGDVVEALHAYLGLDGLLGMRNLIFVCHSMGGIVVRQFLVTRQAALVERDTRVGLFLVASPSLGSEYANLFSVVSRALGNSQAQALRFAESNTWLNDLDRNFMNLKESKRVFIYGRELVEDETIALGWINRSPLVRPFSGARYFGESIKIPKSNHLTIAKPSGPEALQHRLLVQFTVQLLELSSAEKARPELPGNVPATEIEGSSFKRDTTADIRLVDVCFQELKNQYPKLEVKIRNVGSEPAFIKKAYFRISDIFIPKEYRKINYQFQGVTHVYDVCIEEGVSEIQLGLSQFVPPFGTDRFAFVIGQTCGPARLPILVRLQITLIYNEHDKSVTTDPIICTVPSGLQIRGSVSRDGNDESLRRWNLTQISEFSKLSGIRSETATRQFNAANELLKEVK